MIYFQKGSRLSKTSSWVPISEHSLWKDTYYHQNIYYHIFCSGEVYWLAIFFNFRANMFIVWRIKSYMVFKNRAENQLQDRLFPKNKWSVKKNVV